MERNSDRALDLVLDMDTVDPARMAGEASKGAAPPSVPSGRASVRDPGVAAADGAVRGAGRGAATYARRSWPC
ncbi:hypothetical protein GCM10010094_85720 [Streptomyces flaveus]|uniref:Uncharacterized protein n=1 Tax=Streptomyces flaveus TaxID=66370 RepID=A0A917VT53_9ACTN|nr:hypothetical protein GCM10010094_85720 [Streptomyces flaveus]